MFLKSKKFWIVTIILIIISFLGFSLLGKKQVFQYETVKVQKGDLIQTVDVTGKVKSENNISLHFESSGVIDRIYVVEGEEVRKGDVLAKLKLDDLNSLVEQAEANLNQKIAGVSDEQVNVSLSQINAAEVTYKKAEANLSNVKALAEENLKNKYVSALNLLDDSYIKLFTVLKDSEELKNNYFNRLDQDSIGVSNEINYKIKDSINKTKTYLDLAQSSKSIEDINNAMSEMNLTTKSILDALLFIKNVCEGVNYKNIVSTSDKAKLDQNKLTVSASQISLTSAQNEISLLKVQNKNNINVAVIAVEEAVANSELQKANYNSLIANPREVDLAYSRSILNQAIANRNKAIIVSPFNGIITKINKEQGELISSAEALMEALSPKYQVEVNIPETDVVKINIGDKANIELDAIENNVLKAEVINIDPAATTIQDVVYYKVVLSILTEDNRIKPGMTADIVICTEERTSVLYLPSRSILSDKGRKYVRVLKDGEITEKDLVLGLNADDSKKEILSGIEEGEEIILKILD
jgi:RND family efflux transporter MFP subunit